MYMALDEAHVSSGTSVARFVTSVGFVTSQLLQSLLHGVCLSAAVPLALDALDEDPLRSAGQFPGDLLRALMQVPGSFWTRSPQLYERYRDALRRAAAQRRQLPARDRM